jgi:hypothetical protein
MISLKTRYVSTSGWRGYVEPIDAVCGANDTGMWDDSPCPSTTCKAEIGMAKKVLRANKIKFRTTWTQTSNVFCVSCYIVVEHDKVERAKELVKPLLEQTRLLYI